MGTAADLAEDARTSLGIALAGDTTGEKDIVLAYFQEVVDRGTALWKTLSRGMDHAQKALDALQVPAAPPSASRSPMISSGRARTTTASSASLRPTSTQPLSPHRIEELRQELPPPVEPGTGQKTHGRWVAPDGSTQTIVSERDQWSTKVNEALTAEGCPKIPVITDGDVELKLAARMREEGPVDPAMRHVTVVINHVICQGPLSCDTLVPVVLPEGYTLTVHGPGYYKQFTGGTPPWRR
ncbi:DddA-like double-stranded DNA deaminase toxin [Saccharothrix algeriensis]|uniref:SCP1.201-like deaminase n=1 Tax=Saccharothrix algeriensis TaxID=173560 RepID=A0ABS2S1E2_9PSEU|nr:DddA-like double-stranded DNA deaminase toxin [Saccharothrix algeriensis]MBM7810048.1 hypothetical protein [Saccharothrix algeriensis]